MSKAIGPTFEAELKAAGVFGLQFSWSEDGHITFGPEMEPEQIAAVNAVYDAHDPVAVPPAPYVPPTPRQWLDRLAKAKQDAIWTAAVGNPALLGWVIYAAGGATVDVTDAKTIEGVGALVAAGVLSADDQTTLLAP